MKRTSALLILVIFFLVIGCTQKEPKSIPKLNEDVVIENLAVILEDFFEAWQSGDAEKCVSYLTTDYINMPSLDATTDFQATQEMFQDALAKNIIEDLEYKQIEIFVHSNMAYEFGWLDQTWINNESNDTIDTHTRCITVWKKLDDGTWKLHRWMAQ